MQIRTVWKFAKDIFLENEEVVQCTDI